MSSVPLLRARVSELEKENVYLQQQVEALSKQLEQAKAAASQPRPSSSSSAPLSSSGSSLQSPSSSPLPSVAESLSLDGQLHAQALLAASLQASLNEVKAENVVLRGKQVSKTLLMSFTLMDAIKEEKEALRAELNALKLQLFTQSERTGREPAGSTDSAPATAEGQNPMDASSKEQDSGAAAPAFDKAKADGQVPAEEKQSGGDESGGAVSSTAGRAKRSKRAAAADGADDDEEKKVDGSDSPEDGKPTTAVSGGEEEKVDDGDAKAAREKRSRKSTKGDRDKRNADASAVFSPIHSSVSSSAGPSVDPLPTSSAPPSLSSLASAPASSSSGNVRITSNRLPFMEDSPLYRQQLDIMRVRVAAMFSRLDHLAERASEYSRAAMAFAKAGEVFADELSRSWEDVEVNDGGEEKKLMEDMTRRDAAKREKQRRRERTAGPKKGSQGPSRRKRDSVEGMSSASIAEAAHLDSAFLNIGLARAPTATVDSAGAASPAGGAVPGALSPPGGAGREGSSLLNAPARLKNSASAASIKAFLTDIQTKVTDALTDSGSLQAVPSSPLPISINTSSLSQSPPPSVPSSAPPIPTPKRLSASTRSTSITPTSLASSAFSSSSSSSAYAVSLSSYPSSSSSSSGSDMHEADRLLLEREARQKAERAAQPRVEQPVTLSNAMSKMASMVSTMSSVTSNLSMFLEHLLVTAVTGVGERYRVACKKTMVSMETMIAEYEVALSARLSQRKAEREKLFSVLNMFGQRKVLDEEFMRICALRREMEMRRFDHIQLLNEICTSKRMELVEVVCASFLSFVTFFHEGWFSANVVKDDVDVIQESITRRKAYYHKLAKVTLAQRQRIAKSALPINLPVIFPLSPWHELSENGKAASMSGYLRQPLDDDLSKAHKVKEWRRRWFVLDAGSFYYLNEAEYYQPKVCCHAHTTVHGTDPAPLSHTPPPLLCVGESTWSTC